ncbi:DUF3290 family protein [Fructilactobacillus vespulae]|uniref:DUF3290 family protein n=1 Tax=Fructilactobacillus vespulae TaxID=1249630 RepID=UPI0039B3A0EA
MKLYSLQFIEHTFSFTTYIYSLLTAFIALILISTGIFYYRNRSNPRFRTLFILVSLIGALIIGVQTSRLIDQQNSDSKTGQTVQLLRNIAKEKHVSPTKVYANSNTLNDGMTIKINQKYYTVNFNSDLTSYNLQETKLVNKPQLVNKDDFSIGQSGFSSSAMDYWDVALKFIVGLITVVLQINLSGKGNLAPSNAVDQLQNYILGGIIGGTIYNSQITNLQFIIIMLIWSVIVFAIKFLTSQNNILNRLINGSPQVLISNGMVNVSRALKNGMTASELAFKLRINGINSFKEVKNATLEQNGQLTITTFDDEAIRYPIISDGQINELAIKREKLTEADILKMLDERQISLENIYLAQMNNNQLDIVKYPRKSKKNNMYFQR